VNEVDTITSTTLLEGLRDAGNDGAWQRFFDRYQPMLVSFGKKLGLSEQDAQDAAQESMKAFAEAYRKERYDPTKGRLRSWLFGIAQNKIVDSHRRRMDMVMADEADEERLLALMESPDGRSSRSPLKRQEEPSATLASTPTGRRLRRGGVTSACRVKPRAGLSDARAAWPVFGRFLQ